MPLTKAERNALMERLLNGGLRAADLTLEEHDSVLRVPPSNSSYSVSHTPTESVFALNGPVNRGWDGWLQSGTDPMTKWHGENWAQVLAFAGKWAGETAEWERTPDLWALDTATLPEATDNSQFTQPERDDIAQTLDAVEDYVREHFDLLDDQVAAIGQTVKELKEASGRIGRKDWKLVFYGAFVSLGLEHAVSPGVVEAMFRLAVQGLGHIFGAGSPPMISA